MYEKFIFCNLKFFPPFSPNESIYFVLCKKCCESIYFVLYLMRKDCVITHILLQMNLYIVHLTTQYIDSFGEKCV